MPDNQDKDTVTFTITLTVEEFIKLNEMKELEGADNFNEVYKKALNRNYDFLMRIKETDRLMSHMQDIRRNKPN